jgi:hypothetical protein
MEYAVMKAAQPIGTYPTAERCFLKEDGVKEADEKYYRTIDTDKPLFFYKANGNRNGFDYAYAYRIQITSSRM